MTALAAALFVLSIFAACISIGSGINFGQGRQDKFMGLAVVAALVSMTSAFSAGLLL